MQRVKWIGGVALAALSAVLVSLLAQAATNDALFQECFPTDCETKEVLTAGEKTGLDTCMQNLWSDADVTQVEYFHCLADSLDRVRCDYGDERTVNERAFIKAQGDGQVKGHVSSAGGNVTYKHANRADNIAATNYTCFKTWADGVFAGIDKDKMHEIDVRKDGTRLLTSWEEHGTAGDAAYLTLIRSNKIRRRTGTAP